MTKVLIVDDEPQLRRALCASLSASGFEVGEASCADDAIISLKSKPCDLVLLDINMPGTSGVEACPRIRKLAPRAGIVMVTVRDSEDDKVLALEAGADDFITKPYRFRELLARLRAVLRRVRLNDEPEQTVLRCDELELDLSARRVTKAGVEIHLSPTEFDLLALLFRNAGVPLSHARLLRSVWGPEYGGELEYLRSYIKFLRKKIEDNPARPVYLLTEPWVGYRFRDLADGS